MLRNMLRNLVAGSLAVSFASPVLACNDPGKSAAIMDAIRSGDLYLSTPIPEPVTDTEFVTEDGNSASLQDFRGKPTIVSFWYPECSGCQAELPALNAMLGKYQDNDGINFVSLSIRGSASHVGNFLSSNGYGNVEAHRDPESRIFLENCLVATPTHLLIDREGRITDILMGAQPWESEGARQMIERMIAS